MLIKIVGIILICTSSTFLGIYHVMKIKFHIRDLNLLSNALEILKSEIEFGITPLNEATKNISKHSSGFIQEFFLYMNKLLEEKRLCASQIWLNTTITLNKTYIDSQDIEIVKSFANVISNLDRNLQIESLNKIILSLQKKILGLENQYQNEKKLYYNLGFLLGLLTIIIFV